MAQYNVYKNHTSILNNLLNNNFWEQTIKFSKGTKMPQISISYLTNKIKFYESILEIDKIYDYISNINNIIICIEKIVSNLIEKFIKN